MTALPFSRSFKTPIQWQTVLFVAAGGCGLFLVAFWPSLPALGPRPVLVAVLGTVVSFWALGQYDVIWHRTTGTGVAARQAQRSGMAAIAIGQAVGASSQSVSNHLQRMSDQQIVSTRRDGNRIYYRLGRTARLTRSVCRERWLGYGP